MTPVAQSGSFFSDTRNPPIRSLRCSWWKWSCGDQTVPSRPIPGDVDVLGLSAKSPEADGRRSWKRGGG